MTKTLTLIRHAKADTPAQVSDHQRPLSDKGLEQVKRARSELQMRAIGLEQIYCSDALRTRQTAQQLNKQLGLLPASLHYRTELYLASRDTLLACVNATPNQYQHVALIAHNPGLSDLCSHLTGQYGVGLSTCAIVTLSLCVDDWRAVEFSVATSSEYFRG